MIAAPGGGLVGIGTARKIGTHPARNLVKRRVREVLHRISEHVRTDLDYVLILGEASKRAQLPELEAEFATLFVRMNDRWESK